MDPKEDFTIVHATEDADYEQIFAIRARVFEEEMGIPEEAQIDGFDHVSHHYILLVDQRAVAVSRWRVTLGGQLRLERLAVLPEHRHKGYGTALMKAMLVQIPKGRRTYLECPLEQVPFFEKLGFNSECEPFPSHGLLQVTMVFGSRA